MRKAEGCNQELADIVESSKLLNMFVDDLKLARKSPDTINSYKGIVRNFIKFLGDNSTSPQAANLDIFKLYLGSLKKVSKNSIKRTFVILSEFYEFLIINELYALPNPIKPFAHRYLRDYKESSSEERYCPTTDEVIHLVNSVFSARDKCLIVLAAKTGLRRKEVSELDLSSLDMDKMTLKVTPTAKRSNLIVFFDEETRFLLNRWIRQRQSWDGANGPALFINRYGERLGRQAIDKLFRKYANAANLYKGSNISEKVTIHCLRHWWTTAMLAGKMSMEDVSRLRGDAGQHAASRYYHPNMKELQAKYLAIIPQFGLL
jgi:integrase/recombinase XerD